MEGVTWAPIVYLGTWRVSKWLFIFKDKTSFFLLVFLSQHHCKPSTPGVSGEAIFAFTPGVSGERHPGLGHIVQVFLRKSSCLFSSHCHFYTPEDSLSSASVSPPLLMVPQDCFSEKVLSLSHRVWRGQTDASSSCPGVCWCVSMDVVWQATQVGSVVSHQASLDIWKLSTSMVWVWEVFCVWGFATLLPTTMPDPGALSFMVTQTLGLLSPIWFCEQLTLL